MKKISLLISVVLFSAVMALPVFASGRDGGNHGYPGYHQSSPYKYNPGHTYQSGRGHGGDRYKKDDHHDGDHYKKDDYHDGDRHYEYRHYKYPEKGYRSQPHGRYYGHPYRYDNYEYRYHGHWNSWGDWERYQRVYPDRFHHGRYYHDDDGHLFFRFCDPDGGACLFYSIGR